MYIYSIDFTGNTKSNWDKWKKVVEASEIHLHTNAQGKDVVIIVPTMDLSGNHKETFGIGAEIKFTFSGSVCHLFDSKGENLEA